MRVTFAALILIAAWRPWRVKLSLASLRAVALYGATLGLMNMMFYMSLAKLPLGLAIAIEFTGPLTLAVLSSRRLIDFLWIGLVVVGLVLILPITPSTEAISLAGVGYALASAVLWALYIVFGQRLGHLHAGQSTAIGMAVASLVVLPVGFATAGVRLLDASLLGAGMALAIFSSAIPYSLEMYSLKRLPKHTFGILLSLEPAVGALVGLVVLQEKLTLIQWLAIGSIMIASIGSAIEARGKESKPLTPSDPPADAL